MTHETAVLLALAAHYIEEEAVRAVVDGDKRGILEAATSAASLRHVIEYVVKAEVKYGRS